MGVLVRNGAKAVIRIGGIRARRIRNRTGHETLHNVQCDRIEAADRDLTVGEQIGKIGSHLGSSIETARARVQDVGEGLRANRTRQWGRGKVTGALSRRWYHNGVRGDTVDDAPSFIRRKEEGAIFPDGAAKRAAKLILFVVG